MTKKSIVLTEIIIWSILLVFIASCSLFCIKKHLDARPSYKVTFRDIDSIQVGSPVRLMGIQIGHVTKISPTEQVVQLKFVITKPNITIPPGSNVSIQFTGLAGSKSLEILPNDKFKHDYLKVIEPIRITSLFKVMGSISESTLESLQTTLDFFGENSVEDTRQNISNFADTISNLNQDMKKIHTGFSSTSTNFSNSLNNTTKIFSKHSKIINKILVTISDTLEKERLEKIKNTLDSFNKNLETRQDILITKLQHLEKETNDLNNKLILFKDNPEQLNDSINNFMETLELINNNISNENINNASHKINQIKHYTTDINKNLNIK